MDLARAMPKLKVLQLGGTPCKTGGGVTVKGLVALSRGCRFLSELRIHFQAPNFVEAATRAEVSTPSNGKTATPQKDCALATLEVGEIPIPTPEGTALKVTVTLLQIFPHLLNVKFVEKKWKDVVKIMKLFKQIGAFIQHMGKKYLHILSPPR